MYNGGVESDSGEAVMKQERVEKTYEEVRAIAEKQVATGSRSVAYVAEEECLYRGKTISRHDDVPTGYGGRYSLRYGAVCDSVKRTVRSSFSTLRDAKTFIDNLVDVLPVQQAVRQDAGAVTLA